MVLNQLGSIIDCTWKGIPRHFPNVYLGPYVIMPNHIHGILTIEGESQVGATHASLLQRFQMSGPKPKSIGAIVGAFKSATTKSIHESGFLLNEKIWHRNYYDHIIRDHSDYQRIIDYIEENPANWERDREYMSAEGLL